MPALKLHDAGNGFRNNPWPVGKVGTTTMWPSSLSFGASWDVALVEQVAAAIGREYRGKGANVILGPSVQVHRVARNGRNFEYMPGEDPYLGSKLTTAYVRGVQNEGIIACLKHYAYNEQETNRNFANALVDERTMWEIYYPPFEAGVEAGAGSVMCSYNRVNGTHACSNPELLARDLKKRMGFRGFVMSDWWALHSPPASSVLHGFDQEMPGAGAETYFHREALEQMERSRAVPAANYLGLEGDAIYSDAAFRIVAAAHKMRLFERPSCTPGADCTAAIESDQRSADNDALALRTATESIVLLKNDGVLPIRKGGKVKTIALVGSAMIARSLGTEEVGMGGDYYSGGGSGHCFVPGDKMKPPLEHLSRKAAELGISVIAAPTNNAGEARAAVSQADLTIVLAATTAEEGRDRDTLSLDGQADSLIFALMYEKPTVVLMQVPGTILMPWHSGVSAAALMFLGGEHTGSAWASVVFGEASPSGKLPLLIPATMAHVVEPALGADAPYSEGIFSSYRSEEKRKSAIFAFGHGLSYTNFTYGKPVQLPAAECAALACVRVAVSNAGGAAGAEVAQAYVELPPEAEAPKLMLRGFHKTAVLEPGAGETVTFNITARDLSAFLHGGWQLQKAAVLHVGASSADLRHSVPLAIPS